MPRIHSRNGILSTTFLFLGLATSAALAGSDPGDTATPGIADLSIVQRDGVYQVSFRLRSGMDDEMLGNIASGLETAIDYRVEVLRQRRFWPDETTAQHRLQASVKYDSLSRQYSLVLRVDGEVRRSSTTDKPEEMKRWLTEIVGIPLGPVSGFMPPEEFSVRVKSDLRPRFVLFFIPWNRDTSWARIPLTPPHVGATDAGR